MQKKFSFKFILKSLWLPVVLFEISVVSSFKARFSFFRFRFHFSVEVFQAESEIRDLIRRWQSFGFSVVFLVVSSC